MPRCPKEAKRLCMQLKTILVKVYKYLGNLNQHGGAQGVLRKTLEATGERELSYCCSTIGNTLYASANLCRNILAIIRCRRKRALSWTDFSSPAKCYKTSSRQYDWKAFRKHIHQLYEAKKHLTLSNFFLLAFPKATMFAKVLTGEC